ncbi:MAG: FAD-dependent monooxygenase [Planctomycetaceae bacterium]
MPCREPLAESHVDVAIIGAGIAGAMSAILCSRAGLRTVLLERHRFPRDKVCGCCLNGRALQILRSIGLESGLQHLQPATTSSLAIRYGGRQLNVAMPMSLAVSRRSMDQWLVDEAVRSGCHFVDEGTAAVQPLRSDSDDRISQFPPATVPDDPGEREIHVRFASQYSARSEPADRSAAVHLTSVGDPQQDVEMKPSTGGTAGRTLGTAETHLRLFAKIVLVCDGLGHPSLQLLPAFSAEARAGSKIGLGAVFPRAAADSWIRRGEIQMMIAKSGYAGVVEIENDLLNLAAAIDPAYLNRSHSPMDVLAHIFHSAGVPVPQEFPHATIKGTRPLTRSARRIAGHRLLLLGDSTGYVEPFTGEGMAWACTAAIAMAPLVAAVIRDGWSDETVRQWRSTFSRIVSSQQRICRLLATTLRHPWLLRPVMTAGQFFPAVTQKLVGRINRVLTLWK